jgi:site-specific DNA-methyltransferase (adenine-specific)
VKPYFDEEGITIYHGDCREVIPQLQPQSIDLLLTDPPYGQQFQGQALITAKANIRADGARQGMRLVRQMLFALGEEGRVMKPDAHAYLFCHWESWPDFYDAVSSYMKIQNALIWFKNRGGSGDTEYEYARDYEVILYAMAGRGRPLAGRRDGAVIAGIQPVLGDRLHPTEKPEKLFRYMIEKSCPFGGTVLDPFGGAMPAARAAKAAGRRAVVIEIEERYCEIGANLMRQVSMYTAAPPSPYPVQVEGGLFGGMAAEANARPAKCNRHADCRAAEQEYKARTGNDHPLANFHCYDDCCEDCFGK